MLKTDTDNSLSSYAVDAQNKAYEFWKRDSLAIHTVEKICDNPKIGKNKHEDCYEIKLKKFPFTVIYLIDENRKLVIITGVFHRMRDPKSKYRKL